MNVQIPFTLPKYGIVGATLARPRLAASIVWFARLVLWVGAFLIALMVFLQWDTGVHNDFTQNAWLPARLVLDGANPYAPLRLEVDAALGVYSSEFVQFNGGSRYYFIYPMWVAVFFFPLGALPLTLAIAAWRAANLLLLAWSIVAILRASNPVFRSSRPAVVTGLGVILLLGFVYRETITTLFMGQFSIVEFGLLAAIWSWLATTSTKIQSRLIIGDALAGLALAVLATKPQSVGLAVLLVGLWSLSRKRYVVAVSAVVSLLLLLTIPLLFYPSSLIDWLLIITSGQAGSQAKTSASVWGITYALFGAFEGWAWVAFALSLAGVALLVPLWWRDLKDRISPLPLSLPVTLCVNSIISPYLLGYEQVLLLFPALVLLAASSTAEKAPASRVRYLRIALYAWMGALPFLLIPFQNLAKAEYPLVVQAITMLTLCLLVGLKWTSSKENNMPSNRPIVREL